MLTQDITSKRSGQEGIQCKGLGAHQANNYNRMHPPTKTRTIHKFFSQSSILLPPFARGKIKALVLLLGNPHPFLSTIQVNILFKSDNWIFGDTVILNGITKQMG